MTWLVVRRILAVGLTALAALAVGLVVSVAVAIRDEAPHEPGAAT